MTEHGEGGSKRVNFRVDFVEGIERGNRVTYMGQQFEVLEIADTQALRGLELRCAPIHAFGGNGP